MPEFYESLKRWRKDFKMSYEYKMGISKGLQRNEGVGDYFENADGSWTILATQLPDTRHSRLILLHEFIETELIRQNGIPEPIINAFDAYFEEKRKAGIVGPDDEPGDDPEAPYHKEHIFATKMERLMCEEGFRLSWDDYCKALNEAE